jgi:integrase
MPKLPKGFNVRDLAPGKYSAENGATLLVKASGSASWLVRYSLNGKAKDLGLGSLERVTRRQAAKAAYETRSLASQGIDPRKDREDRNAKAATFGQAFELWYADWVKDRTPKYAGELKKQMQTYVLPSIGNMALDEITPQIIRDMLGRNNFWTSKNETARRCKQRTERVFSHSRFSLGFMGANPVHGVQEGLPKVKRRPSHRAALDWWEAPAVFQNLEGNGTPSISALMHQFIITTGLRFGEAQHLEWSHLKTDKDKRLYIDLPEEIAKIDARHVGLSKEALHVLERVKGVSPTIVFSSAVRRVGREKSRAGTPLSTNALYKGRNAAVKALGLPHFTPHGWRTTLRQFAKDKGAPWEVCEYLLGHRIGNSVSQAYDRSDYMRQTLPYLDAWSEFISGQTGRDNVASIVLAR